MSTRCGRCSSCDGRSLLVWCVPNQCTDRRRARSALIAPRPERSGRPSRRSPQLPRVPLVTRDAEALDPIPMAALGADGVVANLNLPAHAIEPARPTPGRWSLRGNAATVYGGDGRRTVAGTKERKDGHAEEFGQPIAAKESLATRSRRGRADKGCSGHPIGVRLVMGRPRRRARPTSHFRCGCPTSRQASQETPDAGACGGWIVYIHYSGASHLRSGQTPEDP
jgi:hypothetical protein